MNEIEKADSSYITCNSNYINQIPRIVKQFMMTSLRTYCRPTISTSWNSNHTYITYRYAQTASIDSEPSSSSSAQYSYTRRKATSETQSDPRKGKGKANELAETYRFPEKGRLGGPPDPFEVMALERGASESIVKQRYYKLALLLHPDSSHPSSSHDHFAILNKAYTLLSTPSSRSAYLKTGYGWSISSQIPTNKTTMDWGMHEEIMRRAKGGTSQWERRKYRDSDAGKGAWGGFDGSGGWKNFNDQTMNFDHKTSFNGTGEERYMSNPRFLAVLGIVGCAFGWIQYHRLGTATETHRDLLDRQNTDASHALAQARYEAAIHGKTRREQIRRRVRESEIMRELEKIESGEIAPHALRITDKPPSTASTSSTTSASA
ncbi:uncharacterized protein I206_101764 [Kwoniella pini CBS 10737]|uniref:J domain-containing protein n=1 Tax=Kwoniella pini CBS 10737 TaxID=1296096 RepID=A0A1B9HVS9_9TREE|nr:uncharacterized protein I206_06265 [Kwoniella pini CBS 10737]OCF47369.1 hypothetical protein I206_06265 [Kwoniella pini CBS 10737]